MLNYDLRRYSSLFILDNVIIQLRCKSIQLLNRYCYLFYFVKGLCDYGMQYPKYIGDTYFDTQITDIDMNELGEFSIGGFSNSSYIVDT